MAKMSARIIKAAMELEGAIRDEANAANEIVLLQARLDKYTSPIGIGVYPPSEAIRWRIHLDYNGRRSY